MTVKTFLKNTLVILLFVLVLGAHVAAGGQIIYVDYDGSEDFNNIQAAIDDSNDGDTIIVADGTYNGIGNRDIDFLGKAITLRSENGPENCIIDCNGTWTEYHRGFDFHSGEDANSIVDGFTITNGYAYDGGGIKCCYSSSPIISNCIIMRNSFNNNGGGIYCQDSSPMLINCTFNDNWCQTAYVDPPEDLRLCGGGMCNYENSSPILINCTFSRNNFTIGGGGIVNYLGSNPMLTNCIFSDNWASFGGGILNYLSSPTLTNCTFSNNDASWGSGLLNLQFSNPTVTNCILWDGGDEIQNYGSTITITYSDVQGGYTGVYLDPNSTLNWGVGNIDADPCFADENNGDYHLKSQAGRWNPNSESWVKDDVTSPCIDAGNPGCPVSDEPDPNGNRRNMGAYGGTDEASKSPAYWRSIADTTNDWIVESNDLKVFVGYWIQKGECIPGDFDRSLFVNFNDFAILGGQWGQKGPGPGITYEVDQCIPTEFALSAAGESEPTRFTVTVEGSNIHFEDLITANCCADEIELQMTVEDSLITIYEIEHLIGVPCPCICDYPITATLGPFEPGTYTFEVYQGEGFIGSTTITIAPGS
ncbi:MAG: right-handed parallel beta-helix repeat-containing protein [Planctomycetota bacterium]